MKTTLMTLLTLLTLMIAPVALAATAQVNNVFQYTTSTIPFGQSKNLHVYIAGNATTTGGNFYAFYEPGGATQKQVAAGKTLFCPEIDYITSATSNDQVQLGTATAQFSDNNAGPLTGQLCGASACDTTKGGLRLLGTNVYTKLPLFVTFAAGTYPFAKIAGTDSTFVYLICLEGVLGTDF